MPHIIHTLADALALVNGKEQEIMLQNPPSSIFYAGAGYYHALYEEVKSQAPHITWHFILDCSDDPALAQQAISLGFKQILFSGAEAVLAKLQDIGAGAGAIVIPG